MSEMHNINPKIAVHRSNAAAVVGTLALEGTSVEGGGVSLSNGFLELYFI